MTKHLPVVVLWAAGWLFASATWSQEPVTLTNNPLQGLIDFHVHSGPDSFTRSITDLEIARLAKDRGMGALVLKNHFTMTADRAMLAERLTGQVCYGGVVLNRALGGLNAEAIRRIVTFTGGRGKVVWLPTFDAENHVKSFGETRPAVRVVKDQQPVRELNDIFELVAKHDLVLETGHIVVASDLGQYLNPIPTGGMKAFVLGLREAGFTADEIELMCRRNPGWLLGMFQ